MFDKTYPLHLKNKEKNIFRRRNEKTDKENNANEFLHAVKDEIAKCEGEKQQGEKRINIFMQDMPKEGNFMIL